MRITIPPKDLVFKHPHREPLIAPPPTKVYILSEGFGFGREGESER